MASIAALIDGLGDKQRPPWWRDTWAMAMAWLFRATPPSRAIRVPLLMVTVAIATGPATYLAISHASEASDHEEQRLHATVEQAFLEHQIEGQVAFEQRLFGLYVAHEALNGAHQNAAEDAAANPVDATHHQLAAQAEWDQVMVVYGAFRAAWPILGPDGNLAYPEDVARTNLRASLDGGRLIEVERFIVTEGIETERLRAASLLIVAAIVGLILSLVFLTLAQVANDRWRTRWAWFGVPIAILSLAGLVGVEMAMEASGWVAVLGVATIVVLLMLSVGDRVVPRLAPVLGQRGETIGDALGETPATGVTRVGVPHPGELDSLFSRIVVVIVALATLCGGWVAYLQADAFAHSDRIGFQARREAITALIDGEAKESRASSQIVAYQDALISDVAVHAADQRRRYYAAPPDGSMPDEAMHHEAETDVGHLTAIATSLRALVPTFPNQLGPAEDPSFPNRMRAEIRSEYDRQEAEDEAHHDQSAEWQRRGGYYAALLVVLAVAVYLLGLSLILPGHKVPVGFALVAVGGLAFAFLWSARTLREEPASKQANVAQEVAAAANAFQEGRYHLQGGRYRQAKESLETAARLAPSLGRVHSDLALAIYGAAETSPGSYPSSARKGDLDASISEYRLAQANGFDAFETRAMLGWELLLSSLYQRDDARRATTLAESVKALESASRLRPDQFPPQLNLALARLIAGDPDAATSAYESAFDLALNPQQEQLVLADALTDLELVDQFLPELHPTIERFKEVVVARFGHLASPDRSPAAPIAISTVSFPGSLEWSADLPTFESGTRSLVQVWYERGVDQRWKVVPYLSTALTLGTTEPGDYVRFARSDDTGTYFADAAYAKAFSDCLPTNEYRVEIYDDGRLAGRSDSISTEAAHVADARDLGILTCVPADWDHVASADAEPGFVDGWTTRKGDQGLVLARIHFPLGSAEESAVAALHWLCKPGISGLCDAPLDVAPEDVYFLGFDQTAFGSTTVGDRQYLGLSGVASDGTVLAAILFGPKAFMTDDRAFKYAVSYVERTTLGPRISP